MIKERLKTKCPYMEVYQHRFLSTLPNGQHTTPQQVHVASINWLPNPQPTTLKGRLSNSVSLHGYKPPGQIWPVGR